MMEVEFLGDLVKYIYPEYSLGVLLITELARTFLRKINTKVTQYITVKEPKCITLIVAVVLSIIDLSLIREDFDFYQALISFSVGVLGYDYVWKVVKRQYKSFKKT